MVFDDYMKRALELAEIARGNTGSNPLVGAVIVKDGDIIAEGYHRSYGSDHAEVDALSRAGEAARSADLYVTLEPCTHFGKTPPCVEAIKSAGIQRVIVATVDPNPLVNGRGFSVLQEAGIEVVSGICEQAAKRQNEVYFKYVTIGLPFITLKVAQTLDGIISDRKEASHWISSDAARKQVHRLRTQVDAVLVGGGTVRADDPFLSSHEIGKDPARIVVTESCSLPRSLNIFQESTGGKTIVATTNKNYRPPSGDVWSFESKSVGGLEIHDLLVRAGKEGMSHILVEGGSGMIGRFVDADLVDKYIFVIAPVLSQIGKTVLMGANPELLDGGLEVVFDRVTMIGGDLWMEAYPG